MKKIQSALILYPNQLFVPDLLPEVDVIYLVEEPLFFGLDSKRPLRMHKQKLLFQRASMRRYVEEVLWQQDLNVEYVELKDIEFSADILVRAQQAGAEIVMLFDPTDHLLDSRLKKALEDVVETPFELRVLPNPGFMLKRAEAREFFTSRKLHRFADFYQWQRERFNILIDSDYKPVGEKWMIETKREVLPEGHVPPGFSAFGDNDYVKEAMKWVEKTFPNNPGDMDDFFWPTSTEEAYAWLDDFLKNRLDNFAKYKDQIDSEAVLLYHSGISALLNSGLLTPKEVIGRTLKFHKRNPLNLASLEEFIREIIGWREYVRGLYITENFAKGSGGTYADRNLSEKWWLGQTSLKPLDITIRKVLKHAYVNLPEREMIIANLMLLSEVNPQSIYDWFASLLIDAYDWSLSPNIYGMTQLSNLGGIFNKPYLVNSDQILKSSHYQKDLWCDIWDGLYWAFTEKHKAVISKSFMAGLLDDLHSITPEHRRIIHYRAEDFLNSL